MQKDQLKEQLTQALAGIAPKDATPQQLHQAIGDVVMHNIAENWNKSTQAHETNRHACYFSMEFLVGRAVFNNLLCLGCYIEVETALQEMGASLASLEEIEDAALGNGGLGRLAACLMYPTATLVLPGEGIGLNYHFGLFTQVFKYRLQLSSFRTTSFAVSSASAEINLYFLMVNLHSYLIFCNKKGGYGSFMSHCHQRR